MDDIKKRMGQELIEAMQEMLDHSDGKRIKFYKILLLGIMINCRNTDVAAQVLAE